MQSIDFDYFQYRSHLSHRLSKRYRLQISHARSLITGDDIPGTIVVRVGNNRPDLGTNPICNRFTGPLEEGQPLFLPCNPPMPGAFVSVHLEANTPTPIPVQLSLCEAFVYTDQVYTTELLETGKKC